MLHSLPKVLVEAARDGNTLALGRLCTLLRSDMFFRSLLQELGSQGLGLGPQDANSRFELAVHSALAVPELRNLSDNAAVEGIKLAKFFIAIHENALGHERGGSSTRETSQPATRSAAERSDAILGSGAEPDASAIPLSIVLDLSTTSVVEAVELLVALSDLYRTAGGDGLVVRAVGTGQPAMLEVGA